MRRNVRFGLAVMVVLISAGASSAAHADELRAPASVRAQVDGSFSFEAKFYKGAGTEDLASQGWIGEENVGGGLVGDCFCIPGMCTLEEGDSLTIQVGGQLTDPALQGRVGTWVSLCASSGLNASTTILPHETTDTDGRTAVAPRFWNAPNPASSSTTFYWELTEAEPVRLAVFDVAGRQLATLVDEVRPAGQHRATWDVGTAPVGQSGGVYFARLTTPGRCDARAIVLMPR